MAPVVAVGAREAGARRRGCPARTEPATGAGVVGLGPAASPASARVPGRSRRTETLKGGRLGVPRQAPGKGTAAAAAGRGARSRLDPSAGVCLRVRQGTDGGGGYRGRDMLRGCVCVCGSLSGCLLPTSVAGVLRRWLPFSSPLFRLIIIASPRTVFFFDAKLGRRVSNYSRGASRFFPEEGRRLRIDQPFPVDKGLIRTPFHTASPHQLPNDAK